MNNVIFYTAKEKLLETPNQSERGLDTNAFKSIITSHTFEDGKGVITFDEDVTEIGDYAFSGCTGLTEITIPNSVTRFGWYAFLECSGLTSITIPDSITSINRGVFNGCM